MTASDNEQDLDADDVTLAASDDVVTQIRAHAAKIRSGEISSEEELHVWTAPPDADADDVTVVAVPAETAPVATGVAGPLIDDDYTEPPITQVIQDMPTPDAVPASPATPPSQSASGSLIDGLEPPNVSATFWTTDKTLRSRGIDFGPRHRGGGGLPMWVWIALVAAIIVLASVGIALAVASTGPVI